MSRMVWSSLTACLALMVAACASDKHAKAGGPAAGTSAAPTVNGGGSAPAPSPTIPPIDLPTSGASSTTAATVDYELTLTSAAGAELCQGDVQLKVMTNFALQFPVEKVPCVSLSIDLAAAFGAVSAGGTLQQVGDGSPGVTSDGYLLATSSIAGASFTPPRPFLLGPIGQDVDKYQGYNKTVAVHLDDSTDAKSGDGSFTVNVDEVGSSYSNTFLQTAFDDVLHWTVTASGFAGVPSTDGLLFTKYEWYYNIQPIMIPKVEIVGQFGDLITASGTDPAVADGMVGELTMTLIAKSYSFGDAP